MLSSILRAKVTTFRDKTKIFSHFLIISSFFLSFLTY